MRKVFVISVAVLLLASCNTANEKGKFTVTGELKNAPDQQVYLEELFFTQKDPEVLDTAQVKNGHFKVSAISPDEGIYRLRLEKSEAPFIFINDKSDISFTADYNDLSITAPSFKTPANQLFRNFIGEIDTRRKELEDKSSLLQQYNGAPDKDSLYGIMLNQVKEKEGQYQDFILHYLDTTSNAVMAMFTMGYTRYVEPEKLGKTVAGLAKRFPGNQAIAAIVAQYDQTVAQYNAQPHEGSMAPDLRMTDTSGKPFALSMLRGKYVLVDFWASWCGPCREENPNVVKAYNAYKDKNFTVLGVSLDKEKNAWIKAIHDDGLAWNHISDLKYWNSAAVNLYGFDGIPYNVLVNPEGKIIGSSLRGADLEAKLAEVIK